MAVVVDPGVRIAGVVDVTRALGVRIAVIRIDGLDSELTPAAELLVQRDTALFERVENLWCTYRGGRLG
ncbi:MAG: hypothetical protein ACRDXB_00125, partial [Actinomycetes bacterium]